MCLGSSGDPGVAVLLTWDGTVSVLIVLQISRLALYSALRHQSGAWDRSGCWRSGANGSSIRTDTRQEERDRRASGAPADQQSMRDVASCSRIRDASAEADVKRQGEGEKQREKVHGEQRSLLELVHSIVQT